MSRRLQSGMLRPAAFDVSHAGDIIAPMAVVSQTCACYTGAALVHSTWKTGGESAYVLQWSCQE
jgi:hypothetical protein